ncbi:MAG: SDR family oxidoreductase [Alphaproteobacteria bacterium]|nr:SDR family oxidoreductase [Alphaproteobacteria bacterium]
MNSLTRQMAFDRGKDRIRVNAIVVGFTNTGSDTFRSMLGDPQIKAAFEKLVLTPYLGESTVIANGAIYLASDESKYVSGTMLTIDDGAL